MARLQSGPGNSIEYPSDLQESRHTPSFLDYLPELSPTFFFSTLIETAFTTRCVSLPCLHLHRSVSIAFEYANLWTRINVLFGIDFPILDCFPCLVARVIFCVHREEIIILEQLFDRNAPRLSSLRLSYCGIDRNTFIFSSGLLTRLNITSLPISSTPSYPQLLRLFGSFPKLKDVISCPERLPSFPEEMPPQNIPLPNPSGIVISGSLWDCARLLSHLDYPPA